MTASNDDMRRRYLKALGIPIWERRATSSVPDCSAASAEEPTVAQATALQPPAEHSESPGGAEPTPALTRERSIACMDWSQLHEAVPTCTACGLHAERSCAVFGVGDRRAAWLIIGEAPGAEEDRRGEPFVGRAGKLLDKMLRAVGLQREQVFIGNVLKCRPPSNRDPRPEEVASCRPFLERQIALIQPRIILSVGRISAQHLLGTQAPVGRLRGRVHRFDPGGIPLIVSYHPAYLLRQPSEKRKAWEDLRLAKRTFEAAL